MEMEINLLNELFVYGDIEKPDFLLKIYNAILKDDNNFHFIDEAGYGGYLLIRYSPKLESRIKDYCSKIDEYQFSFNGKWKESAEIVFKYPKGFRDIFHAFSKFLLENYYILDSENEEMLRDRMFHLLYNMMRYTGIADKNEMRFFSDIALDRSYTWGYVQALKDKKLGKFANES